LRAEATADAAKREALAGEIDKLLAEAASNADERKALSDQTDELSRELQMERSRLEHIEGEFTRLREPVEKARGQIANLIAGVHSEKSAAARSRGLFRRPAHSSHLDEVLTAADAAKTALSSAALQIQSLAKEANLDRPWEQGHQTVITQDSGLNARIQDLNARIYQMGMLATDLRRSHWLKFGDRLGVGASNRADAIIAIFDKWKQQSDPHDPDETPDS
jgi:chromosome segregation ATPase